MTKTCVVCKKQPIPLDNSRIFHKFPKNDNLRKRWLEILNLSVFNNNMSVCSDHFDERSYEEADKRRLNSNAVPSNLEAQSQFTKKVFANVTNCINIANNNDYSPEVLRNDEHNYSKRRDAIEDTIVSTANLTLSCSGNVEENVESNSKCLNVNELLQNSSDEEQCFIEYSYELSPNVKSSPDENDVTYQESLSREDVNTENNGSRSIKRKRSLQNVPPTKKFRFVTELQTEQISREDFVSNEAWERFVRLMITHKTQLESASKKSFQQQKKIEHLEKLVSMLRKNEKKD